MYLYLTFAFVAIPIAVYYYLTRTFEYWKKRNVKYPKPVPLFGNIMDSALNRKHYFEIIRDIYEQFPNEKVVGIYRMTTPCLLIRDLDLIKQIMIKDFDKFADRGVEFSKEGLGVNLFHTNADTWRVLRDKFTPIFTSGKLKNMLHLMTDVGDKFVDYVSKECLIQTEQEACELLQKYFAANISACAFGLDLDITSKEQLEQLKRIDNYVFKKTFITELDMMYPGILLKLNKSLFPKALTTFFEDMVDLVITQRNGKPTNRRDLMDFLLEMKNEGEVQSKRKTANGETIHLEITNSLMAAQAALFYTAGYETSNSSMVNMLYLLAKYPDVQDKVQKEIEEVLEKHNGNITYEALNEMIYLDKVFSETLRLLLTTDLILRRAQVNYVLPGTDIVIPKGQTVIISGYGIHHDEKYYPDPEKFDPERFSPEIARGRHPCAFMAFGVGPRNCIGMRFSKIATRVCAVKLLSKFRVEPSKNTPTEIKYDPSRVIMSPQNGIHLNFVPRIS